MARIVRSIGSKTEASITSVISCHDISKVYQQGGEATTILEDISFDVPKGRILGLIGRSGAGKSTLLRVMGGLTEPTQGHVILFHHDYWKSTVPKRRELLRKIGTVFQDLHLLSRYTVAENIALPLAFMKCSPEHQRKQVFSLAEEVGLTAFLDRYPAQLSGGQRQRVAIARALSSNAQVLLCDELTSALDREVRLEILELLQEINHRHGVTIILVTHDMEVVREICDDVCVMDRGRIVESGTSEKILLKPQHETTKALLGHLMILDLPHYCLEQMRSEPFEGAHVVLQVLAAGDFPRLPFFSDLVKTHDVTLNFLGGHVNHIKHRPFGNMIVDFPIAGGQLEKVVSYFARHHIETQIIGYIES